MKEILINQVLSPIIGAIVSMLLGILVYYVNQFYNKQKRFLELQERELIQKIGIEKYSADVEVVKNAVKTVEQIGKEKNWMGDLKYTKALEIIKGKTGLTDEDIYNIIKAAVLEVNAMKKPEETNLSQK